MEDSFAATRLFCTCDSEPTYGVFTFSSKLDVHTQFMDLQECCKQSLVKNEIMCILVVSIPSPSLLLEHLNFPRGPTRLEPRAQTVKGTGTEWLNDASEIVPQEKCTPVPC